MTEDRMEKENDKISHAFALLLELRLIMHKFAILTKRQGSAFALANLREFELRNGRHATITDLVKLTGRAMPNVCRLLRPLEEKGLLRREKEGRSVCVRITPAGEAELERLRQKSDAMLTRALSAVPEEEQSRFFANCNAALSSLDEAVSEVIQEQEGTEGDHAETV